MPETISDTGPILHLHEIGRLTALAPVSPLRAPDLVWTELQTRGLSRDLLQAAKVDLQVVPVDESVWKQVLSVAAPFRIQPADAQVFALARSNGFQSLVLTDDLPLRRLLERNGTTVVGSVGVLVKAYTSGQIRRVELDRTIEALFDHSSLHLSRAFRTYLKQLLSDLP